MRLIVALGVAAAVVVPTYGAPRAVWDAPDPGFAGPYAIGHTSLSLIDTSRSPTSPFGGRPIPVNVWYPVDPSAIQTDTPGAIFALDAIFNSRWPASTSADWEQFGMAPAYEGVAASADKPFPLVMVSPGYGARYFSLMFYAERLASHGFVVAVLYHAGDGAYPWDPVDPFAVALLNRPKDVSFALDALLARNADVSDILFNSIRPDQIAASGHSLGGYAAMALAGGDDEVCGTLANPLPDVCNSVGATLPDPRIRAIVPLDGSNQVLHFSELARITVPSMAIGQAWENVVAWQARQHVAIAGHPSYRADVREAVHGSFNNSCAAARVLRSKGIISAAQLNNTLSSPPCALVLAQPEVNRLAAKYAIAFLKTHLAGETGYQRILTPGWALTSEQHIEFFVTEPENATALGEDPTGFKYFLHQPGSLTGQAVKDPPKPRPVEVIEG